MNNPMELSNRLFLVSGASSGIGRETSILLSSLGARVILLARNTAELKKTYEMLDGDGHQYISYDLSSCENIPYQLKEISSKHGPLNGLVHCAGLQFTRPIRITNALSIEELMRINVTAALCLVKGFRQKGVYSKNSGIVFLSSVMGIVGQPGQAAYSASKGAITAMTKSLALELAGDGIRVNSVAPAIVQTEMSEKMMKSMTSEQIAQMQRMHPLGFGKPRDVANAIAFLLADTGTWITGTTLVVDGGYTSH